MAHRERVFRGPINSDHIVHFFDDDAARARAVSTFIRDGLDANRRVLIVARPSLWGDVAAVFKKERIEVASDARLVVLDAYVTLAGLLQDGRVNGDFFQRTVAPLVQRLCATAPNGISIYGEMVDILAAEGNFAAACELENAWNWLAAETPITLLCGYAAAHFAASSEHRDVLTAICAAHSHVLTDSHDALGQWLVGGTQAPGFVS